MEVVTTLVRVGGWGPGAAPSQQEGIRAGALTAPRPLSGIPDPNSPGLCSPHRSPRPISLISLLYFSGNPQVSFCREGRRCYLQNQWWNQYSRPEITINGKSKEYVS